MIKRIDCEGVGDNDGFFEVTPDGSKFGLRDLLAENGIELTDRCDGVRGHFCIRLIRS